MRPRVLRPARRERSDLVCSAPGVDSEVWRDYKLILVCIL
jgi:hypothetical protein